MKVRLDVIVTRGFLISLFIECKYMEHIFELRMKDQIEERSLQLLRNCLTVRIFLLFDHCSLLLLCSSISWEIKIQNLLGQGIMYQV